MLVWIRRSTATPGGGGGTTALLQTGRLQVPCLWIARPCTGVHKLPKSRIGSAGNVWKFNLLRPGRGGLSSGSPHETHAIEMDHPVEVTHG